VLSWLWSSFSTTYSSPPLDDEIAVAALFLGALYFTIDRWRFADATLIVDRARTRARRRVRKGGLAWSTTIDGHPMRGGSSWLQGELLRSCSMSSVSEHPALPHLGRPMTLEEWAALPEDEPGELVDGHLEEEEAPNLVHETVVAWFLWVLKTWLSRTGFVFGSEVRYAVRATRGRKPDLAVYLDPDGSRLPRDGVVRVPPDIVIEVVCPSPRDQRRDRIEKMDEYAAFGVRFYWILDPGLQSLKIFELTGGRYARATRGTEGRMESVPGCAGLVIDLDDLWSEIARLGPPEP
jgi:Uma2 family endonuclease